MQYFKISRCHINIWPLYETMHKIFGIFLLTFIVTSVYSQDKLSTYKTIIDRAISAYFNPSLINKIECKRVSCVMLDNKRLLLSNYDAFKDDTINFAKATFTYSFFSDAINDFLEFGISIDKNKLINTNTTLLADIPKCIVQNLECDFIKKDSAIKIAVGNSIEYSNSLKTQFKRQFNTNNFYWIVTGNLNKLSSSAIHKTNTNIISLKQQKIINAQTGEIISREEYNKIN